MKKKVVAKTGKKVPTSGLYRPSGGSSEVTFVEDKKVPPNKEGKKQEFTLETKTPHKRKKR
jgi:hypothetical protein